MANQAWQISAPGKLSLVDLGPAPEPGPRQVLVRVQAVALNYRDVLVINHDPAYIVPTSPNLVPCSDGAGVIEDVGAGSTWMKGDRIFFHPNNWQTGKDPRDWSIQKTMGGGPCDGTLRRYIIANDVDLVRAPDNLSIEEAATIYTAGVTAWNGLMHGLIKLKPGMTILTQGTGGVSCYAIQIAAAIGATVVATSSSDEKLAAAQKIGATHLINYRKTPDWTQKVLNVTNGQGVDIVVDVVGAGSIEQTVKAVRHGGLISLIGLLDEPNKPVDIMTSLLFGAKTIQAILGAGSRDLSKEFSAFLQEHSIHPPISQTFAFEDAEIAVDALKRLKSPGKIVIKV